MYRSSRAVALAAKTGEPLPRVEFLRDLYAKGTEIYRGSLVMVAGQPGASKSMFALNLVHEMNVPTLYVSADSDAATQISRLAAMTTGVTSASIRAHLDDDAQRDRFKEPLTASKVQWSFDSNPDAYDIEAEINAWVELYDTFPEVIVIDNLRNVFSGADNEHAGYKAVQQSLIDVSRATGAMVLHMHHMSEANNRKSTDPSPRSAIDGKVAQLPAQILSVARDEQEFRLCVVKDRENENDPEAKESSWVRIRSDGATSRFFAMETTPYRAARVGSDIGDGLAPAFDGW